MGRRVWSSAIVAICIALVAESARAQPAPTPAPAAPPPPTAADPAAPPTAAAPQTAPPAYPPPPPAQGGPQPGYVYPPGYGYPPGYDYRAERRRHRRPKGLMIAGLAVFGVSYVFPAMAGILVAGEKRSDCDCRDGYRMLIPVLGPLTLLHGDRDYELFNAVLVTDAIFQAAGLALSIWGILKFVASANGDEYSLEHPRPAWSFDAAPMPGGAYGALRLRL